MSYQLIKEIEETRSQFYELKKRIDELQIKIHDTEKEISLLLNNKEKNQNEIVDELIALKYKLVQLYDEAIKICDEMEKNLKKEDKLSKQIDF